MAVINKNLVSVFGHGIFGRAVLNLDFDSQNIPSELYDRFRAVCGLARPSGVIEKRYPWQVKQPGTSDQGGVWDLFLQATRCFAKQPDAGGVEPPAIGPRNRSWWYDQSISSGLFYYDYFMKETLALLHQDIIPDWCKILATDDSAVLHEDPDNNYGGEATLDIYVAPGEVPYELTRLWLKTPGEGSKILYLYCRAISVVGGLVRQIGVYQQLPGSWAENVITWNNQPVIGSKITSFSSADLSVDTWLAISIGTADSVCIKFEDETEPPVGKSTYADFHSSDAVDISKRPYLI